MVHIFLLKFFLNSRLNSFIFSSSLRICETRGVINEIFIFFNMRRTCRMEYFFPIVFWSKSATFFDENPELLLVNSFFLSAEYILFSFLFESFVGLPLRGRSDKLFVCLERQIQYEIFDLLVPKIAAISRQVLFSLESLMINSRSFSLPEIIVSPHVNERN